MDSDILGLGEGSCELKEGLCDPKKILDLSPFFLI